MTASGARAVIARAPFGLAVQQADGAPALAEVANRRPRPLRIGPLDDPFAPGLNRASTPTLYAPLTFLVGAETLDQYQGGLWGGNLLSGTRSGVLYSARRVLSAKRAGNGVRLLLSTSDPSGRRLLVTVSSLGRAEIRVTVVPKPARGVVEIGDSFHSSPSEAFFGFGGLHNAVNQRGQVITSFTAEENAAGYNHDQAMYPNGNTAAYYPQAEFFSTRAYGFLLAQSQLARFKLDVGAARAWNVTATARSLDYVVAPGAATRAMATDRAQRPSADAAELGARSDARPARYDRDLCFPAWGSAFGASRENMVGVRQAGLQVTDDRS